MSLFDLPIEDAKEREPVPEGEYELMIYNATEAVASTGRPMINLSLQVLNEPDASLVFHNITGLMDADDEQKRNTILLIGKRFCEGFGIETPINVLDLPGKTGRALLTIEEDQNGIPRNRIKRVL